MTEPALSAPVLVVENALLRRHLGSGRAEDALLSGCAGQGSRGWRAPENAA
jgi:hypothetical protein